MFKAKTVWVILPAYNEAASIGETIAAIPEYVDRIVVVDDGSRDRTAAIADERGAVVIRHRENRGVGAALKTGIREALASEADIVVNIDADGQFDPRDITTLIQPIADGKAEFVSASRFIDQSYYPQMSRIKFWGNRLMSRLISRITGQRFYDVSCGFRAYSRDALLQLNLFSDFTYTQESFLDFAFKNVPILEVPVKVRGRRRHGKSRVAANIIHYAFQTIKIITRTFRDYHPFRLFSGLALTLLLPGLALAVFTVLHYTGRGTFTPHKWAAFTAGFLFLLSALSLFLGFILDMFARMRLNQEDILYFLKKREK